MSQSETHTQHTRTHTHQVEGACREVHVQGVPHLEGAPPPEALGGAQFTWGSTQARRHAGTHVHVHGRSGGASGATRRTQGSGKARQCVVVVCMVFALCFVAAAGISVAERGASGTQVRRAAIRLTTLNTSSAPRNTATTPLHTTTESTTPPHPTPPTRPAGLFGGQSDTMCDRAREPEGWGGGQTLGLVVEGGRVGRRGCFGGVRLCPRHQLLMCSGKGQWCNPKPCKD